MPAILNQVVDQPIVARMTLWKALAFAAGLGLSMLSYTVHAAPASGDDAVQGLYDALHSTLAASPTVAHLRTRH